MQIRAVLFSSFISLCFQRSPVPSCRNLFDPVQFQQTIYCGCAWTNLLQRTRNPAQWGQGHYKVWWNKIMAEAHRIFRRCWKDLPVRLEDSGDDFRPGRILRSQLWPHRSRGCGLSLWFHAAIAVCCEGYHVTRQHFFGRVQTPGSENLAFTAPTGPTLGILGANCHVMTLGLRQSWWFAEPTRCAVCKQRNCAKLFHFGFSFDWNSSTIWNTHSVEILKTTLLWLIFESWSLLNFARQHHFAFERNVILVLATLPQRSIQSHNYSLCMSMQSGHVWPPKPLDIRDADKNYQTLFGSFSHHVSGGVWWVGAGAVLCLTAGRWSQTCS